MILCATLVCRSSASGKHESMQLHCRSEPEGQSQPAGQPSRPRLQTSVRVGNSKREEPTRQKASPSKPLHLNVSRQSTQLQLNGVALCKPAAAGGKGNAPPLQRTQIIVCR